MLRFALEHPVSVLIKLKRNFEDIFILTQREKCTGVLTSTTHLDLSVRILNLIAASQRKSYRLTDGLDGNESFSENYESGQFVFFKI